MDALLTTILKRPYVFLFLAGFLFLSIRHQGYLRTLIWLAAGYAIAFLSEYSSIHNGFPYGEYHYIYDNLKGELILAGVPVWDSLSYAFLSYAGYSAALFARPGAKLWKIWLIGSLLTCVLDIVVDPVAKLGKEWFLGEIYFYAEKGIYFNVPWTNFAGWFLVAAAIIGVNIVLARPPKADEAIPRDKQPGGLHILFYLSICLFATSIAFAIGAYLLGIVNLAITAGVGGFIISGHRRT
jgi:putative membrane protein